MAGEALAVTVPVLWKTLSSILSEGFQIVSGVLGISLVAMGD